MSAENVEVARQMCEAFGRRDYEEMSELMDESYKLIGPPDVTAGGEVAEGLEASGELMATWLRTWDDYLYEVRNAIDYGSRVLVEGTQSARGRSSGVPMSEDIYTVVTVLAGKAVSAQILRDRDEAVAAAKAPTGIEPV